MLPPERFVTRPVGRGLGIPTVQKCYYVTGDADFVLIVTVDSMSGYDALTRRLFFANHNVRRFRALVVMDRIKAGLAVQLPNRSREPI